MLKNINHDLIKQLSVISSSVWRIKNIYKENALDCKECLEVWNELEKDYERHITLLAERITKHAKENSFL